MVPRDAGLHPHAQQNVLLYYTHRVVMQHLIAEDLLCSSCVGEPDRFLRLQTSARSQPVETLGFTQRLHNRPSVLAAHR